MYTLDQLKTWVLIIFATIVILLVFLAWQKKELKVMKRVQQDHASRKTILPIYRNVAVSYVQGTKCPRCNSSVGKYDRFCKSCGGHFMDEREWSGGLSRTQEDIDATEEGHEEQIAEFICPGCGASVDFDAHACYRCKGRFWSPIQKPM